MRDELHTEIVKDNDKVIPKLWYHTLANSWDIIGRMLYITSLFSVISSGCF